MKNIITLGPDGSYSSQAAKQVIPQGQEIEYMKTIPQVIEEISSGKPDCYGLIPISNKYGGSVQPTFDTLYQSQDLIEIYGWTNLAIHHVYATLPDTDISSIKKVYSHPQALKQCKIKIDERGLDTVSTDSTTAHIPYLSSGEGVVCSKEAAEAAGLKIIDTLFCPEDNETRFAIIGPKRKNQEVVPNFRNMVNDRLIAILELEDRTGSLRDVLKIIKDSGLSLHFIHSYLNSLGGYDFPLVMDNGIEDKIEEIIEEVETVGGKIKVLDKRYMKYNHSQENHIKKEITNKYQGSMEGKIQALLKTGSESGALYDILEVLKEANISIHHIHSDADGNGRFDFPIVIDDALTQDIIQSIIAKGGSIEVTNK